LKSVAIAARYWILGKNYVSVLKDFSGMVCENIFWLNDKNYPTNQQLSQTSVKATEGT